MDVVAGGQEEASPQAPLFFLSARSSGGSNTQHCVATACVLTDECPARFVCDAEVCVHAGCDDNDDCDGACVNGRCCSDSGTCVVDLPPP